MTLDEMRKLERTMEEFGLDIDDIIQIIEGAMRERDANDNRDD